MKTIFYLKTCSTCTKILKDLNPDKSWTRREIKSEPLTDNEIDHMREKAGSYEALFSKKSSQIRLQGLEVKTLKEDDFKRMLGEHYTFLKRPVFLTDNAIFIGSDKKTLENLRDYLERDARV